jgi:hypothetical protein
MAAKKAIPAKPNEIKLRARDDPDVEPIWKGTGQP